MGKYINNLPTNYHYIMEVIKIIYRAKKYKNKSDKTILAVKLFWTVFQEQLDENEKKKFFTFVSGLKRVPVLGMNSARLRISINSYICYVNQFNHVCMFR